MEYADAIRILKEERELYESDYCTSGDGTPDGTLMAAIDEAIEALEKQIPKEPHYYGDEDDGKILCPNCETDLYDDRECGFNHCPYCGQAIDWSEEE